MKSINIEILMGHSISISDSYYRITEDELQKDYQKATSFLIITITNEVYGNSIFELIIKLIVAILIDQRLGQR